MKCLCWLILLFSFCANARVITESFTSTTNKDSSTLIWNTELGKLHPSPLVYDYGATGTSHTIFSVSDGSHGAFELGTYEQFGTVAGNIITLNISHLKVTRFQLAAGYTLTSSSPIIIHSLSTVIIDGSISCGGDSGSNPAGTNGGNGGAGHCGGYAGGNGGNDNSSGADGLPTTGNITGGGGGLWSAPVPSPVSGAGGGGGGSYYDSSFPAQAGYNGTVTNLGGNAGSISNDHEFININGSGGGGGGTGSGSEGGGGGGAGGGTVIIHAVSSVIVTNGGSIIATGGNGGSAISGGGGGGGGGGNIAILTPANFEVEAGGLIAATHGDGASSTSQVLPDGKGGNGAPGRVWLGVGNYTNNGTISGNMFYGDGLAGFVSGTVQTATSKSFDTGTNLATYQSIAADSASSDITIQVAGSDDNFASDDSGWINAAAISGISKKRYIKFRLSLNNSDALNPTFVDEVNITYDPGIQENFTFKSSGCGLVKNPPNSSSSLIILLLLAPLFLAWRLRKPKTVRVRVRK